MMRTYNLWMVLAFLGLACARAFAAETCVVCGLAMDGTVYMWEDKVENVKKRVCRKCIALPTACFMCSMPLRRDYTELSDGRVICNRDARRVVLSEEEAIEICKKTKVALDRQFSRFISFPDTNFSIALADRVNILNLFQMPGRDYECPNVLGYLFTRTNQTPVIHEISLLTGLPVDTLKATFVHEYTHAWVAENVPFARRKRMNRNAEEGFCELVAYLRMEAEGEEGAKKAIKLNAYTRGQFELFLAAESQFGFNEIVEWMKHGEDSLLVAEELARVRAIEMPSSPTSEKPAAAATLPLVTPSPRLFEKLTLKGVMWSKTRPMAVINDRTFAVNEEIKLRLGGSNLVVRCLEIREDSVVIRTAGSSESQTLWLKER